MYMLHDQLPRDLKDSLLAAELRHAGLPVFRSWRDEPLLSVLQFADGTTVQFKRSDSYWVVTLSEPLPLPTAQLLDLSYRNSVRTNGMSGGDEPTSPVRLYHVDSREGLRALVAAIRSVFPGEFQTDLGARSEFIPGLAAWRPAYYESKAATFFWIESLLGIAQFGELFRGTYDAGYALELAYKEAQEFYGVDQFQTISIRTTLLAFYERKSVNLTQQIEHYPDGEPTRILELEEAQSKRLALMEMQNATAGQDEQNLRETVQALHRQAETYWRQRREAELEKYTAPQKGKLDSSANELYFTTFRLIAVMRRLGLPVDDEGSLLNQFWQQMTPDERRYYTKLFDSIWT